MLDSALKTDLRNPLLIFWIVDEWKKEILQN